MTLHSLLWDWYKPRKTNLKESSAMQLQHTISSLRRFHGREIQVEELSEELLLPWIGERMETRSKSTARRDLGNVLALWRFAFKRKLCPTAPPDDIDPIRVDPSIPRAWTVDELSAILSTCRRLRGRLREVPINRGDWWASLILFLYDTGARITAATNVLTSDLHPERQGVILRHEFAKTSVEQFVPLRDETLIAIGKHYDLRRPKLFPYPWCKKKIWLDLKEIQLEAGVDCGRYVGFHQIRRTTATQMAIAGGMEMARLALGHTRESMTRRYVDQRQVPRPAIPLPLLRDDVTPEAMRAARELALAEKLKPANRPVARHPFALSGGDPAEWEFGKGVVGFRGKWFPMSSPAMQRLLTTLAKAEGPVDWMTLFEAADAPDVASPKHQVERRIHSLRRWLRLALNLKPHLNPIPSSGGAYTLSMPVKRSK